MKAIMVMYDSLNRRFLENYGCDFTKTPNFKRLAEKTAQFDNFYVGSLPCIPARRELHTGRHNFLHRSWGPLEPFDNSMPKLLKDNKVFTRLVTDHGHYFEDGGATYHTMFDSWEFVRGQEGDQWLNKINPDVPKHLSTMREFTHPDWWRDNWGNRKRLEENKEVCQTKVFDHGIEFIDNNINEDNWFLQIEAFDPHEPFDVPKEYQALYDDLYKGDHFDWPPYSAVSETKEEVQHIRKLYAALITMCDYNLGRVLDKMDEYNMWEDTMLIVNTDHGYLLGEKDWWAKSVMPCYNELANVPFFLWDPRVKVKGVKRKSLCQTIDIPATLLEFFNIDIPKEMMGKPLKKVLENDEKIREYGIFGYHGSFVNITDGKYVYMKSSKSISNTPLYEYTLMPTHQQGLFKTSELRDIEIIGPLPYSKGCKLMKIKNQSRLKNATFCNSFQYGNKLFNLENDPNQINALDEPLIEARFLNALIEKMKESDAPSEQYERLGLISEKEYKVDDVINDRCSVLSFDSFEITRKYQWEQNAQHIFIGFLSLLDETQINDYFETLDEVMSLEKSNTVTRKHFEILAKKYYSNNEKMNFYFLNKLERVA